MRLNHFEHGDKPSDYATSSQVAAKIGVSKVYFLRQCKLYKVPHVVISGVIHYHIGRTVALFTPTTKIK